MSLTPKQKSFVAEYLADLNATQAAIRAGYSAKTAHAAGPRLLGNVGVAEAIAAAQVERSARARMTADDVVARLEAFAMDRVADQKIAPREQLAALAILAKHHGLLSERVQLSGGLSFNYGAVADRCRREIAEKLERLSAAAEAEKAEAASAAVLPFQRGACVA